MLDVVESTDVFGRVSFQALYVLVKERGLVPLKCLLTLTDGAFGPYFIPDIVFTVCFTQII